MAFHEEDEISEHQENDQDQISDPLVCCSHAQKNYSKTLCTFPDKAHTVLRNLIKQILSIYNSLESTKGAEIP